MTLQSTIPQSFRQAIHGGDPYAGFPVGEYKLDLQGFGTGEFGSESPLFEAVISTFRPQRLIEVGSWKGASAVRMAAMMKKHGVAGEILCVDTRLGTAQTWLDRQGLNFIPMRFGRPVTYEQFLANVILSGQADTIVPFSVDSITAAEVIAAKGLKADAIYIDAGHDYDHVDADIKAWWPNLRPAGLMFGDDYHPVWEGLVRAVQQFAGANNLKLQTEYRDKWYFQKPA